MSAFQKVVAIILFLVLVPQTLRHVYVRWFEPRGSVLDKYKQPMRENIQAADSLDELLKMYDKVYKEGAATRRQGGTHSGYAPAPDSSAYVAPPPVAYPAPAPGTVYSSPSPEEMNLEQAIREWESGSNEIYKLRFYWSCGFLLLLAGVGVYWLASSWGGLTLAVVAFSEMIYWTCPAFLGMGTRETDRLLVNKLVFSVLALLLLTVVICVGRVFRDGESKREAVPSP